MCWSVYRMYFEEIKRLTKYYNRDVLNETTLSNKQNINTVKRAIKELPDSQKRMVIVKELQDPINYALYNFSREPVLNGLSFPCCAFTREYPLILRYACYTSFSSENYSRDEPLVCTAIPLTNEFREIIDPLIFSSQGTQLLLNHVTYYMGTISYFIDMYVDHPLGQLYYVVQLIERWWLRTYPEVLKKRGYKREHSKEYRHVMDELKYLPLKHFPIYKRARKEFSTLNK